MIAESYERIHHSKLACMGVLPLQFLANDNASILGLDGSELISFQALIQLTPGSIISVSAHKKGGVTIRFLVKVLLKSEAEIRLWQNGGIFKSFVS